MTDSKRDGMRETPTDHSPAGTNSRDEHDRIRASNDRDQQAERAGAVSPHNRGYDQAVKGQDGPTDPDSAESENDRDDTIDE